jgi:hypothetical protein
MSQVVHPGSGHQIRIQTFYPSRIPEPGSESATLLAGEKIKYRVRSIRYLIYLLFSSRNISPFINMLVACSR